MGTWGYGPFDSDHAADFAGAVEDCSDTRARADLLTATLGGFLEQTFTRRDFPAGYEFPYPVLEAVAAAAFVADSKTGIPRFTDTPYAQKGQPAADGAETTWHPIELDEPASVLVELARRAMSQLLEVMRSALVDPEYRNVVVDILEALA